MTDWVVENKLSLSSTEESVLFFVSQRERYGLELIEAFSDLSKGEWQLNFGTVYPCLRKLEERGYVSSRQESASQFCRFKLRIDR